MIKLIATDIDGTLLVEGSANLNPEYFDVIRKLKDKGIIFAASSGREYSSIRHLFEPIQNDMIFICDNGAHVVCRGTMMNANYMNEKNAKDLLEYIRALPGCFGTIATTDCLYTDSRDEEYVRFMKEGYHVKCEFVDDLRAVDARPLKISIFRRDGIRAIAQDVIDEWEDRFRVMIAGDPWLDFVDYNTDKGNALRTIQKQLLIKPEESMAFGDNHNDVGMLQAVGESYAVANAQDAVKDVAKHIADTNLNNGVLKVIKTLL